MAQQVIELIQRVKTIVGVRGDFFDTVWKWYKDVNLARKLALLLLKQDLAGARVSITVNGQQLASEAITVTPQAHHLIWTLPSQVLTVGQNEIAVSLESTPGPPLCLQTASAAQERGIPRQMLDLSAAKPARARHLIFVSSRDALYQGSCWALKKGGYLTFGLSLEEASPVVFTLGLGGETAGGWGDELEDVLEDVLERVHEKIRRLEEEKRQAEKAGRQPSEKMKKDLEDLEAYSYLHKNQVLPAFRSADDGTLKEVIARTGDPNVLIQEVREAVTVRPLAPSGGRPERRPPVRATVRQGRRSSGGSCLGVLVVLVLIAVPAGYLAWQKPSVQRTIREWLDNLQGTGNRPPGSKEEEQKRFVDVLREHQAAKGDVEISLQWFNKNDLDLHVVCPSGERISFEHKQSKCGGQLQIDMNVDYAAAVAQPVEHIFWPPGQAPRGRYQVFVKHFNNHRQPGCEDPTRFNVRVVVKGRESFFAGEVVHDDPNRAQVLVYEFTVD
jgi:hypothetical protein